MSIEELGKRCGISEDDCAIILTYESAVRKVLGMDLLVGVSCHELRQREAELIGDKYAIHSQDLWSLREKQARVKAEEIVRLGGFSRGLIDHITEVLLKK